MVVRQVHTNPSHAWSELRARHGHGASRQVSHTLKVDSQRGQAWVEVGVSLQTMQCVLFPSVRRIVPVCVRPPPENPRTSVTTYVSMGSNSISHSVLAWQDRVTGSMTLAFSPNFWIFSRRKIIEIFRAKLDWLGKYEKYDDCRVRTYVSHGHMLSRHTP